MPKIKVIPLLEVIFKNKGKTSELWKAINECLQNKEQEIAVFSTYIKHKINSYDKENSLLALDLIDFCIDYGGMPLWIHISSKDFLSSLVTNLKTRDDTEIQSKILFLIEKWGKKFSTSSPELSNFQKVYMLLLNNNVSFPVNMQSNYNKYVKMNTINNNYNDFFNKTNDNYNKKETDPENYLRDINLDLNTSSYEKKYKRLVNKLYDWTHAIHEVNVLINQNNGGINNDKISGLIKDLSRGNNQLIETIESGKLKDQTLMKISLCVNSDIEMTEQRWSNFKKGIYPNPFISSFLQDKSNNNNYNNSNSSNNFNNNNNYNNKINNNIDLTDFYNVQNNQNYINNNMNNFGKNNSNNSNKNNMNSFNLLIDFNCNPAPLSNNINSSSNMNLNLNDKNNMNNYFNFVSQTENQNQNKKNNQINIWNNNFNNINISNLNLNENTFDTNNKNNNNINNNNINYNQMNNFEANNDDNITRQSLMYPSFDELNDE